MSRTVRAFAEAHVGRLWVGYLLLGLLATAAFRLFPSPIFQTVLIGIVGISCVTAIVVGTKLHRPATVVPWAVLAAALLVWGVIGFAVWQAEIVAHGHHPAPGSVTDVLFYLGELLFVAVLALLLLRREPGAGSLIEAGIVGLALATVAWLFLIQDYTREGTFFAPLARGTQIGYALLDVLILALAARILISPGRRTAAYSLLLAAVASLLTADLFRNWLILAGSYIPGSYYDIGWLLFMVLPGAAALHPSMRTLFVRETPRPPQLRWSYLLLLAGAALTAPGMQALNALGGPERIDVLVYASAAATLSFLVLTRTARLIYEGGRLSAQLAARNEQLRKLAAIVESSDDAIMSSAADGTIDSWNPGAERTFGYSAEEIIGRPFSLLVPPERSKERVELFGRVLEGEGLTHHETVRLRKDGGRIDVSLTVSPIRDSAGRIIGSSAIARDITEQRTAARALRESEERFRTLVENVPGVIYRCACDSDWTMEFLSDEIETISGYPASDFIQNSVRTYASVIHPDDRAEVENVVAESVRERRPFVLEYRIVHADGTVRWVYEQGQGVFRDEAEPLWLDGAIVDISERKEIECQRERLLAAEQAQNDRLRDLDRMKDSFVASVSHELRTPLTSISGFLELVLQGDAGELTAEQKKLVEVVRRNAERLHQLVNDLLFVAQVDAGRLDLERADVDLGALVAECIEAARPLAEDKPLDLVADYASRPTVAGDPRRLHQLLNNLVSNAIKFTPPRGRVTVRVSPWNGRAVIEVEDTGIGVAAADVSRLFERFFRGANAAERAIQGTGLGLSIVKAIVEAHGGEISVDSEEGVGTRFRVELPLSEPQTGQQRHIEVAA